MRAIKYLPNVLTNSTFYLRNAISYSLQKLNSIEFNVISGKKIIEQTAEEDFASNYKAFPSNNNVIAIEKRNQNNIANNDGIHQIFVDAINDWISSSHQTNNKEKIINNNKPVNNDNSNDITETNDSINKVNKRLERLSVVSKSDIESRTLKLINSLKTNHSPINTLLQLQELSKHLINYPESGVIAANEGAIQYILRVRHWSKDRIINSFATQVLTLLGYCEPPKANGIRILSIDGGGTRGVLVIEMLRQIEKLTGKPIHQLFDLICGVSTGAIIAMLIGALQTPINECEHYYSKFSSHLFKSDFWRGAGRLIMSHAYYDTSVWEDILKEIYSETDLIETAQYPNVPRVIAISAVMNKPSIQAFLFRNYELPIPSRSLSQYEGSCKYKIWESVRASASAPGYFEEFTLDNYVHQDGGILINNPTAIAIHEAKMLWPNEQIQCLLSIGSGRYIPPVTLNPEDIPVSPTSLRTKLSRLIDSATDTEIVHRLMHDLLPNGYYRLNPNLTELGTLAENRPEKLKQMKTDAQMYLRKNEFKVNRAIKDISKKRHTSQNLIDWLKYQYCLRI